MASVGDTNIHIQINGTTFAGIFELVGPRVKLISADFGDQSAEVGNMDPQYMAEQLLRTMIEQAIQEGTVFVRDDDT